MPKYSQLAETLIGSEIVKLGNAISERIRAGEKIYNFTIGDFDPSIFPIPEALEEEIIRAYKEKYTNYPSADGILELRQSVQTFIRDWEGVEFQPNEIQIASGGRPLIFSLFQTLVDKGDKIIYGVPSWNNNHYVHMTSGEHCVIECRPENDFMPTVEEIRPHVKGATLLCICTPQNPTGTTLNRESLEAICDLVLEENKHRGDYDKKLYVMFDQMYWTLTYGNTQHFHPIQVRPSMKPYTIYIGGISKAFAATGVRVGWALGPEGVIAKMKAILSHVGAWAPMAEQKATARFLQRKEDMITYFSHFKAEIEYRLRTIYDGIQALRNKGYSVDCIEPQAAIYLTLKLDLVGKTLPNGKQLEVQSDVTHYILDQAKLAVVPFSAFGMDSNSPWYRMSIGTCKKEEIATMLQQLEAALEQLA